MTNPIEAAIFPIKADAVARAEADTRAHLAKLLSNLADNGMNLTLTSPRAHGRMSKGEYQRASALLSVYHRITTTISGPTPREPQAPTIVEVKPAGIEKLVEMAREDAATQYDAFVAKLLSKIGEVTSAKLEGNHVWGYSVLTVTKADGSVENWKTQQIVNVSKLGNLFNQWPSRKVK